MYARKRDIFFNPFPAFESSFEDQHRSTQTSMASEKKQAHQDLHYLNFHKACDHGRNAAFNQGKKYFQTKIYNFF